MPLALRPEAYVANTATVSPTNNPYVNGVLAGVKWTADTLTFSFPTSRAVYGNNYGDGENSAGFGHFNNAQQQATREVLDLYASVANIHFVEINESQNQHATLRFAESNAPTTAWAYYPQGGQLGGDVWLRHSLILYDSPVKGNYGYTTLMHEIGHALGLKHPHEVDGYFHAMPHDHDSVEYSVMSYRSYVGASKGAYTNGTWSFPQTLMMYDIAAIQTLYGANYQTNGGDTTYHWDPNSGEFFINDEGQGAPIGNRVFMTLWDGGGHDTYDFSNYGTDLNVDLQPGGWSTISAEQLAGLGYQRYAHGNIANALLYHNNPASLIEDVIGGSGDDVIVGNIADNTLTGGQGNDFLDGGFGADSAVYSGFSSEYSWVQNADNTWTISDLRVGAPDGTDILKNIQYLDFTDLVVGAGARRRQRRQPETPALSRSMTFTRHGAEPSLSTFSPTISPRMPKAFRQSSSADQSGAISRSTRMGTSSTPRRATSKARLVSAMRRVMAHRNPRSPRSKSSLDATIARLTRSQRGMSSTTSGQDIPSATWTTSSVVMTHTRTFFTIKRPPRLASTKACSTPL